MKKTKYYGIYELTKNGRRLLFTKSLDNISYFNEVIKNDYREFNPKRSKLAAAIMKNISFLPFEKNKNILYLGAAHGYTCSFISDIIEGGEIFCLDFAPKVVRDLYLICLERKNMIPILANAAEPETYEKRISNVSIIYQDIAHKNQVDILLKNLRFLKKDGTVLLSIKARSIDVTKNPRLIFIQVEKELRKHLKIIDKKILDPFEKDHCFFVCQKK